MHFAGALLKCHLLSLASHRGLSVPTKGITKRKNQNSVDLATCLGSNAGNGWVGQA